MKFIVAIIKPEMLDAVRDALSETGVEGMTVTEVRGYGRQRGQVEVYRGVEYDVQFMPKIKLEIAVSDDGAEEAARVLGEAARSGRIGDGKIFVCDLLDAVRIRTGESGSVAL